jgi:hypothetical protein
MKEEIFSGISLEHGENVEGNYNRRLGTPLPPLNDLALLIE